MEKKIEEDKKGLGDIQEEGKGEREADRVCGKQSVT